jgi:uncharacterized DUF497 family protein
LQDDLFEWDDKKASRNIRIRGISFEEAKTVFEDPYSITQRDEVNSDFEDRFVTIGLSLVSRVLFVVHAERGKRIRIISARKPTPSERAEYDQQRQS